ncbi:alpha/beta fold hydrolase [Nonomuraea sp. MCN248]|uniref:Alpha/beta fold hydrolase n=1 Tax=Nonomuraea corallina TaxID=2989783 RepID=A0ABT4S5V6_9ACTN|nr:alpha/beta hydrolase [Nonomuraea corallina]MDA0632579.1 alpha/beta fold hydrolase [Nonomuraea corallina]
MPKIGRFVTPEARAEYERTYDQAMAALPPPAETRDVPTPFGRVRAYRFGPSGGTPLVLLHGKSATSVMWLPNLPGLAAARPVYALDLLGEGGRSEQTAPIRDAADQAAWLSAALAGLGLGTAHLVGMSMGGWLACNQAVRQPRHVASITLLDPAGALAPMPLGLILRTIPVMLPFVSRWARPRFMAWIDGTSADISADDPVARLISATMRDYRPALPPPTRFTDEQLRSITVPALVVVAGRSVIHDPGEAVRRAERLIPGVRAELWPEATHSIAGQFAPEVNERVLKFTASLQ